MIQACVVKRKLLSPQQKKVILLGISVLLIGTWALAKSQKQVSLICRDARLFMDGGYSAMVKVGGLIPTTTITLYQKRASDQIPLGEYSVRQLGTKGIEGVIHAFKGEGFNLSIFDEEKKMGHEAQLQALVAGREVNVAMRCQ